MRAEGEICLWEGVAAITGSDPEKQRAVLLFKGNQTPVKMMWTGDYDTIEALLESDYPNLNIVTMAQLNSEIDFLKQFGVNTDAPDYELDDVETAT